MLCAHAVCVVNAQRYKGTRIEITGVVERLTAGEPIDAIVHVYRGRVSREAIVEATQIVTTQFLAHLPSGESTT